MSTFTCTGFVFIVAQLTCTVPEAAPAAVCPPVRTWSRDFQKQVADEVRAAPGSALAKMAVQYIGDRDIARACRQRRKQ
jgi:hypothetical protein